MEEGVRTIYLRDYQVPAYFIDEIDLTFDLFEDYATVTSHMAIHRNPASHHPGKELVLNGDELVLETIRLNGKPLSKTAYTLTQKFLMLHHVPDHFELDITTKIYPQKNTALSGLYRSQNVFCTQCEAEGFRRITYFLDHPDILARYNTTIIADETKYPYLLSNGNLVDSGKLENGRHWAKWQDPFKKPCYLFALVAGNFDLVEDQFVTRSQREISLRIYVDKGFANQTAHALYALKEAMRWDEENFGREYDLDIYMIVAIADFNMGAMENKGLNIFNTKYILAQPATATDIDFIHILAVVSHEYFHNWTGNRVTCRDWFQLSLKEGLTIFRDQLFVEDMISKAVMRILDVELLRETQFPEDSSPLAHPVRPESYIEINNFYTATVYNKGAEVLRMLRTILGSVLFRKGMDLYFERYDGQAVTIEDYLKTMEDVSGIDLTQFRLWYSQAGTPIVNVSDDYDGAQKIYTLSMSQTCLPTPGQPEKKPFLIPIRMGLLDQEGKEILLQLEEKTTTSNETKLEKEKVLQLNQASQIFQFKHISTRPVPSLLRHFSAPIILNFSYSDNEFLFLCKHDSDLFNRWEAGQKYALRTILNLVRDYQQDKSLSLPQELRELYAYVLQQTHGDQFLLAKMLRLPSEKYIGEQMEVIDVDAIHAVREFVRLALSEQLQNLFLEIYKKNHQPSANDQFDLLSIGHRQLKNECLYYLMLLPNQIPLGMQQFESALQSNMTDTQAALVALVNMDVPEREMALDQFYETWKEDSLVVDKWFAIQAGTKLPIALQQVKKLARHPAFDIKNPNKVYALISTFGYRNPVNFHSKDGEGYAFLRDIVQQIDHLNPQVAAKMAKPLTMWKRYDKERQELMCQQLELFLQDKKISKDLFEIVTKSLEL